MSELAKRLRASVSIGAVNGDEMEQAVCANQMKEAANMLEQVERSIRDR